MRRYCLDATLALGRRTGIGRAIEEVVAGAVALLEPDETLTLLARTFRLNPVLGATHEALERFAASPQVRVVRINLPTPLVARTPVEIFAGAQDVVHGPHAALPRSDGGARGVVTIHDIAPLHGPPWVSRGSESWFRRNAADAVARADRIVTPSEFVARDVTERLGADPARVVAIPLGVSERFAAPRDGSDDAALAALRVARPYVLAVGAGTPRKNLARLVEAFARVRAERPDAGRLVVVGEGGEAKSRDFEVRLGWVDEKRLPVLYRNAAALAFPSLHEGFGLPVLEAMAAGCPVLASDATALPETAGDAALLVDPSSVEAIAQGLLRLLGDADLRERLVAQGRRRAAQFPWAACAERHVALWRHLAAQAPRADVPISPR